jgi:hypothetical protein
MTKRTWIPEAAAVILGTFALIFLMACGSIFGFSRAETGIALAITIGAIAIHRLTEAISRIAAVQGRDNNVERLDVFRNQVP